ncbi:MAG TPA: metal ABC transporter permease, partial [Methanoculleus sp.]|nr:metal ABC transporter permease [Methanoculleus sp.]
MNEAFLITTLVAVPAALLSCFLVLKGWALLGDAVSHAVFPGVVLSYIADRSILIGAFAFGSLTALGIGILSRSREENIRCSSKIVEGRVREEVVNEANSGGYGLVVMGAFGKSGKARIGALIEDIGGVIRPPLLIVR